MGGNWVTEMLERADRYRNFDEAFWAPYKTDRGGWDYMCCMLDVAYADRDEASGPYGYDEAAEAFASRVVDEESRDESEAAVMVRVLTMGFTRDAVVTHGGLGVFEVGCNVPVASCLDMNGGMMTAGCGNMLSDRRETRWEHPVLGRTEARARAYRRREARKCFFSSLTNTREESLAAKRTWEDGLG